MVLIAMLLGCGGPAVLDKPNTPPDWLLEEDALKLKRDQDAQAEEDAAPQPDAEEPEEPEAEAEEPAADEPAQEAAEPG